MKPKVRFFANDQGFTIIELMITITIAAILLMLGIPSFTTFIGNQKLIATASEFYSAVNLTRSEAIKRGARVDLVPNNGVSWNSGWTVFIDVNSNQLVESSETILFKHDAISSDITIASTSINPYISYIGNGRTRTNVSSQTPGPCTVSFTYATTIRRVAINFLGRSRICNPSNDLTCTPSAS